VSTEGGNKTSPCSHPKVPGGVWQDGCLIKRCESGVLKEEFADECAQLIDAMVETILADKLAMKGINCSTEKQEDTVEEKLVDKLAEEEPQVLVLGPGKHNGGKSEVLSLPDLEPVDCNIPVFPGGAYWGYVGRSTSDGVLMCGGRTETDQISSCHLLTSSGYQDRLGLINYRYLSASMVTPLGLWITGGWGEDTTEIVTHNQSLSHVRLPESMRAHCLVSINKTHSLLTGGRTGEWYRTSRSAYLYSEEGGFTKIDNMRTKRHKHGCSLINSNTVLVAGGEGSYGWGTKTELLDLTTMKWSSGPSLPGYVTPGYMVGNLLIGVSNIYKLREVVQAQRKEWTWDHVYQKSTLENYEQAFVLNQNVLCNK